MLRGGDANAIRTMVESKGVESKDYIARERIQITQSLYPANVFADPWTTVRTLKHIGDTSCR